MFKSQLQNSSTRKIALLSCLASAPSRLPHWAGRRRRDRSGFACPPQGSAKSSIFRCRGVLQLALNSLFYICLATGSIGDADETEISKAIGHMIGKTLQTIDAGLNMEAIAKGIQEEMTGLPSPLTDEECLTMLDALEKKRHIKEANDFLALNAKAQGVTSLASGKLQYKVLQEGKGEAVQTYNAPLVRLKQEGANQMATEEILSLDDLIEGLKLGIVGMHEGEIRKFYIHPELGYENQSSLLIFEVEIIKADASAAAHAASNNEDLPLLRRVNHLF